MVVCNTVYTLHVTTFLLPPICQSTSIVVIVVSWIRKLDLRYFDWVFVTLAMFLERERSSSMIDKECSNQIRSECYWCICIYVCIARVRERRNICSTHKRNGHQNYGKIHGRNENEGKGMNSILLSIHFFGYLLKLHCSKLEKKQSSANTVIASLIY